MSVFIPIQQYIALGHISAYLAGNDTANDNALKGGSLSNGLRNLILTVTEGIEWAFSINPNDQTLDATGLYLYALCGRYISQAINILNNQAAAVPMVSGPSNQAVNVGDTATFTITITSTVPTYIQWYKNGVLIPGATGLSYSLLNAQLSDTNAQFSAIVTGGPNPVSSSIGILTVTSAAIIGRFTYSADTNFYPILLTNSDPFSYGTSVTITHNAPIVFTLPSGMPANVYMLAKIPIGESVKTIWNNTALNNGLIPDAQFEAIVQFGGFTYYASRGQISMDVTQTLTFS